MNLHNKWNVEKYDNQPYSEKYWYFKLHARSNAPGPNLCFVWQWLDRPELKYSYNWNSSWVYIAFWI